MPRLIRRQPLLERIQGYLNPADLLLWLSEEFESQGWDQLEKEWALPIGFVLNLIFIVARANSRGASESYDDVFGDTRRETGWFSWLASFLVHFLALLSFVNATCTFWRKRHYRLFEASVDTVPSTPSAYRVRVDSSPISSSPLRFLSNILGADSAQSRAHPDPQRDVWELALWDPLPVCLRLFCYFSPGHVLIYCLFLPTAIADPRPSMTIVTAIAVSVLLSVQLSTLQSSFSQQTKDSALISKELLHEYDTKFVHPRTQPLYRDVGTQFTEQASHSAHRDEKYNFVEVHTPRFVINRGFKINPNPNYSKHTDPDGVAARPSYSRGLSSTPSIIPGVQPIRTPANLRDSSSPTRPSTAIRQPQFKPAPESQPGPGGSLGVYSHANSPLKKNPFGGSDMRGKYSNDYNRERSLSPEKRPPSPAKRMSVPSTGINTLAAAKRWGHLQSNARRESGRF
ncbi:hypothetical protein GJ744_007655 [Endocarpon pusillum]|uniref:Meiotically up-regulated gene 154 protein n=1 Tax=Endocarpon pusillum TaxID=364733 RepID=A0A8H7AMH9_9EURO|nr:hypothetical protein GJ744_007655 [Endocarpon pusillum]